MLGVDLGEAVGLFDHLSVVPAECRGWLLTRLYIGKVLRGTNAVAHAEGPSRLARDGAVVARDHLDDDTLLHGALDSVFSVGARRVEEREQPHHLHRPVLVPASYRERTDATVSKVLDTCLELAPNLRLVGIGAEAENNVRRALHDVELAPIGSRERRFGSLELRAEGLEVELLVTVEEAAVEGLPNTSRPGMLRVWRAQGYSRGGIGEVLRRHPIGTSRGPLVPQAVCLVCLRQWRQCVPQAVCLRQSASGSVPRWPSGAPPR